MLSGLTSSRYFRPDLLSSLVAVATCAEPAPFSPTPAHLPHRCRQLCRRNPPPGLPQWALGGYASFDRVPNLGPTHRRFMTENMAYAILRAAPALFYANVPILACAIASHLVEALTIAWEIIYYDCPANAMLPVTLMGIFSTQTLLTVRPI